MAECYKNFKNIFFFLFLLGFSLRWLYLCHKGSRGRELGIPCSYKKDISQVTVLSNPSRMKTMLETGISSKHCSEPICMLALPFSRPWDSLHYCFFHPGHDLPLVSSTLLLGIIDCTCVISYWAGTRIWCHS